MNEVRQKLTRSAYLVALAGSMVAWLWVLYAGMEWAIGA